MQRVHVIAAHRHRARLLVHLHQPARHHVAVADGLHLVHTERVQQRIQPSEQVVLWSVEIEVGRMMVVEGGGHGYRTASCVQCRTL
mgnify:CR=1 FL=1